MRVGVGISDDLRSIILNIMDDASDSRIHLDIDGCDRLIRSLMKYRAIVKAIDIELLKIEAPKDPA